MVYAEQAGILWSGCPARGGSGPAESWSAGAAGQPDRLLSVRPVGTAEASDVVLGNGGRVLVIDAGLLARIVRPGNAVFLEGRSPPRGSTRLRARRNRAFLITLNACLTGVMGRADRS